MQRHNILTLTYWDWHWHTVIIIDNIIENVSIIDNINDTDIDILTLPMHEAKSCFWIFFHHSCEFFLIMTCTSVIDTQGLINPSYLGHHFDFVSFHNSRSLSEICPIIRPIYLPMSKYITSYHKKHSPTKHITMMLGEIKTIKAMLTLLAPNNRKIHVEIGL